MSPPVVEVGERQWAPRWLFAEGGVGEPLRGPGRPEPADGEDAGGVIRSRNN